MENDTDTNPRNEDTNMTSSGSHFGEQPLQNEPMKRTTELTCTQKLTIPTLEKQYYTNANMWWRKFVPYIKMTKDLLINNDKQQRDTATTP